MLLFDHKVRTWDITVPLPLTLAKGISLGFSVLKEKKILHPAFYPLWLWHYFLYTVRLTEKLPPIAHDPVTPCCWNLPVYCTHDLLISKTDDFGMLILPDVSASSDDTMGNSFLLELSPPLAFICTISYFCPLLSLLFMEFSSTHPINVGVPKVAFLTTQT